MGNVQNSSDGVEDLKDWQQDAVARRVTICEVQFAAEEERERRIENGRPDIYEIDVVLQALFEEIKTKKDLRIHSDKFSSVMRDLLEKKLQAPVVTKKRSINPTDLTIVNEHHMWAKRQKSNNLTEQERARQLSTQMYRQSSTVDNYQRVVSDIRIMDIDKHQPSLIMKKQQLNAMIKTHQHRTASYEDASLKKKQSTTLDRGSLLHDLCNNQPILKPVKKVSTDAISLAPSSATATQGEAIPRVLSAFSTQFPSCGVKLSGFVQRATAAGVAEAELEHVARIHNDKLSAVNDEFMRIINKEAALRDMDDEKEARVACNKYREVMNELTHIYNGIVVGHLRSAEQQTQINRDRFRIVCDQLLRQVHQDSAVKAITTEQDQRIAANRLRNVLNDLTRRVHQQKALNEMNEERERRMARDNFHHVLFELSRFCNAVTADCQADQEKSRRIAEPPSARKIFSSERINLLRALERKVHQKQALQMMHQEQQRRITSSRISKTSDMIFLKQQLNKEVEQLICVA